MLKCYLALRLSFLLMLVVPINVMAFNCGPHAKTFKVYHYDGGAYHLGVRCVYFGESSDRTIPIFSWYGEGRRGQKTYRHVGQAIMDQGKIKAYAADIYGNGESYSHLYPGNITISAGNDYENANMFYVGGAWHEIWIKVGNVSYTPLNPPSVCGSNVRTYYVSKTYGEGLRCVLRPWTILHTTPMVWYGTGYWYGKRYTHLGMFGDEGHGAIDLCGANFGEYCGHFSQGSLHLNAVNSNFQVSGAWNELWEQTPPELDWD